MANREIKKVSIDGYALRSAINDAGYSIRRMATEVNRSDRQIRHYLDSNEMPIELYEKICDVIDYNKPMPKANERHMNNLVKKLKNGITQAKGVDADFLYITVGDAKRVLKMLEEEK